MSLLRLVLHCAVVALLTALTQLGGIAYLLALLSRSALRRLAIFLLAYLSLALGAVYAAPLLGRVPLPCVGSTLRAQAFLYCALNRHYVSPEVRDYADDLAEAMEHAFPGTVTQTLDAGFPFLTGFPLLPHLSHDDGWKLDLAFYYADADGRYLPGDTPSPIGYWAFVEPAPDASLPCHGRRDRLTLRWDMGWLSPLHRNLNLEPERTRAALQWMTNNVPKGHSLKILLEPHLKEGLGLTSRDIRFQGCSAARHDDHIHLQLTPITP